MSAWNDFDIFHLPAHCVALEVVEEITTIYPDRTGKTQRTGRAWFDAYLNEFHDGWGKLRGEVLRWRAEVSNG
jgi:hypothetical protein